MGKWKPWNYIPNQSKYANSYWGVMASNANEQKLRLEAHNDKQRKRIQQKRKK